MRISLQHSVIPAADHERAARFFATVMGLDCPGPGSMLARVRVSDSLTLDFATVPAPQGNYLTFGVDPETFDGILARIRAMGVPYGSDSQDPDNGRVDHPLRARGLYFADVTGKLYAVTSPA